MVGCFSALPTLHAELVGWFAVGAALKHQATTIASDVGFEEDSRLGFYRRQPDTLQKFLANDRKVGLLPCAPARLPPSHTFCVLAPLAGLSPGLVVWLRVG